MPLTLEEAKSLGVALGVNIPSEILEQKEKAEEFKLRQEKITAQAGEKPGDWRLRQDFGTLLKQAAESAAKMAFAPALKLLDEAEQLFSQPDVAPEPEPVPTAPPEPATAPAASEAPAENSKFSIVQLQQSRLAWDSLRKSVQSQLQDLEKSIVAGVKAHNGDETREEEYDEDQIGTAVKQLYTIMQKLDTRLLDTLDDALNAKDQAARESHHAQAAALIKEYQGFLDGDPILAAIDNNGFTKSSIRSSVAGTLTELAGRF